MNSKVAFVLGLLFVSALSVLVCAEEQASDRSLWTLGTVPPDIKTTFTIISWEPIAKFGPRYKYIEQFFKTYYPNVTLKVDYGIDWDDYFTKLSTMIATGNPPDLVWMHDTRVADYAARGALLPLTEYIRKLPPLGWPDDWYEAQIRGYTYEGEIYGIPQDLVTGCIFFNKDLFDAAGVPYPPQWSTDWTFEDMIELARKLTRDTDGDGRIDQWGLAIGTWEPHACYWVVRAFGGDYLTPEGEPNFDNPRTIEAIKFLRDMYHTWKVSYITPSEVDIDRLFMEGKLAMYSKHNERCSIWMGASFNWGVAPEPRGPAGRCQFMGSSCWSIPKGAKNPDLAYEVIRYALSNPDSLKGIVSTLHCLPPRKSLAPFALSPELAAKVPNYTYVFVELAAKDALVPPYFVGYEEFVSLWHRYLDPVFLLGEEDVRGACEQLNAALREVLKSYRR